MPSEAEAARAKFIELWPEVSPSIDMMEEVLSAASAVRSEGVKVRALEWKEQGGAWNAETPFGLYDIAKYGKYWAVYLHNSLVAEPDSADAAKSAAEQDYQNRILSAITSPVQTREDGIREAARRIEGYIIEEQPGDVKTVLARKMAKSILALLSQPEPKGDKT
jgi:hypothetical protein